MKRLVVSSFFILLWQFAWVQAKYSSKTAYLDRFSESELKFINDTSNYGIQGCQPEQIYIFLRHGARTPSQSQVIKSQNFLETYKSYRREKRSSSLDESNVLDQVEASFADGPFFSLSELGQLEMRSIARRFRDRYPTLFCPKVARLGQFDIMSSDKSRTIESAFSFIQGLFEDLDDQEADLVELLSSQLKLNDSLLRQFDKCDQYVVGVKNNMSAGEELTKFENGPEMRKLVNDFIERHSISDMDFKTSVIQKLFTICTIEMAHKMKENWCRLFDNDDLEVLAYHNDLESYWLKSYGHEIVNSQVALLLFKDMFDQMESFIKNTTQKLNENNFKVLLRFGHAENMIPMLTALGLFKEELSLRADNFDENLGRRFRTGHFSPFSANLAFVLHKCDPKQSRGDDVFDQYKVHVLVNELPVDVIDGGPLTCANSNEESLCDFKNFKAQLKDFIEQDLSQACSLKSSFDQNGEL